ncbi:MAG: hypothetical protein EOO08_11550 [Chitinophagaceae bacterium]|nr:MAG: hypothetical protein EOO08_11550 [Chitinophagaceae bacterium]
MNRWLLLIFLMGLSLFAKSQHHLLLLKKGPRTVATYWEGAPIAFQLNNGLWQKGELVALRNDSIFVRVRIVRYYMIGNDTLTLPLQGFALNTISAFPKKGIAVDFRGGEFRISKSGSLPAKLLKIGAIGYTALGAVNGLREGTYSIADHKAELIIAGAAFAAGVAIDKLQRYTWTIGRKYHLEVFRLDGLK